MRTHFAVGLTTSIQIILIGDFGKVVLLAKIQYQSAIIQVKK